MRLGDVGGLKDALKPDVVGGDPLWDRSEFDLTDNDIQLFYARCGLKGVRQEAIDAIDQAQAEVIRALFCGELPKGAFANLVLHDLPPKPFMADEFVDGLIKLRPSRRGACIFMLENKLNPGMVTDLTWQSLDVAKLSKTSMEVVNAAQMLRHIRLPYVFWEWATPNIASPLLKLEESVCEAFGCTLPELHDRYGRMIPIDRRADAQSFLSLLNQLGGGKGG